MAMSTVFAILFLITLGLLVWGVISPKSMSAYGKKPLTRRDAGIGFGIIAVIFLVLTGVTAPHRPVNNAATKPQVAAASALAADQDQQAPAPVITTKTVTETEVVPFASQTVENAAWDKGATQITTPGVAGVKTRTFQVTYEDGKESKRTLLKEEITTAPITQITTVGTKVAAATPKPASSCDPNYSGACVPIARDVDCEGGSGDGPAYVRGPVTVIGTDIYRLDSDHDGVGCE